jgi:hypothetical protein
MPERKPEFVAREKIPDFFPGLNPKTLANLASLGRGPCYFLVGRRVFYRYEDLVSWLSRNPVKTKES